MKFNIPKEFQPRYVTAEQAQKHAKQITEPVEVFSIGPFSGDSDCKLLEGINAINHHILMGQLRAMPPVQKQYKYEARIKGWHVDFYDIVDGVVGPLNEQVTQWFNLRTFHDTRSNYREHFLFTQCKIVGEFPDVI